MHARVSFGAKNFMHPYLRTEYDTCSEFVVHLSQPRAPYIDEISFVLVFSLAFFVCGISCEGYFL